MVFIFNGLTKPIPFALIFCLTLGLLSSCSGSQTLQNRFAANPDLQKSPENVLSPSPLTPVPSPSPKEPSQNLTPEVTETTPNPNTFDDLSQLDPPFRDYVQDLAELGVISAKNGQAFQGNSSILRREFARWLFTANNRFYAKVPSNQIRLAQSQSAPIFSDVPRTDPDFLIIQGLAEAGLISSSLTNDANASLFRPEAPLTREVLMLWKVPLDSRRPLPNASLENLKETWGFQDVSKTDPKVWRALYSDFQNGEQSIIRRVFGFTTLFQPKKTVTRTQAAAALWYFGFQGEGLSARDVLSGSEEPPSVEISPSP